MVSMAMYGSGPRYISHSGNNMHQVLNFLLVLSGVPQRSVIGPILIQCS